MVGSATGTIAALWFGACALMVASRAHQDLGAVICTETTTGPCTCEDQSCHGFEFTENVTVTCKASSCNNVVFPSGSSVECLDADSCRGNVTVCEPGEYGDAAMGCHACPAGTSSSSQYRGLGPAYDRCTLDDDTKYTLSADGVVKRCTTDRSLCAPHVHDNVCYECDKCMAGAYATVTTAQGTILNCRRCPDPTTTPDRAGQGGFIHRCTLCVAGAYGRAYFCKYCPKSDDIPLSKSPGTGSSQDRCFKEKGGLSIGELWAIIDGFIFFICIVVLVGLRHWYYRPGRNNNNHGPQDRHSDGEYETIDMSAAGKLHSVASSRSPRTARAAGEDTPPAKCVYTDVAYEEAQYDGVLENDKHNKHH